MRLWDIWWRRVQPGSCSTEVEMEMDSTLRGVGAARLGGLAGTWSAGLRTWSEDEGDWGDPPGTQTSREGWRTAHERQVEEWPGGGFHH